VRTPGGVGELPDALATLGSRERETSSFRPYGTFVLAFVRRAIRRVACGLHVERGGCELLRGFLNHLPV
jgi:hypothetical protein